MTTSQTVLSQAKSPLVAKWALQADCVVDPGLLNLVSLAVLVYLAFSYLYLVVQNIIFGRTEYVPMGFLHLTDIILPFADPV